MEAEKPVVADTPMKNPFTQTQTQPKKKKKLGRNELTGLGIIKEEGNFIITFL